MKAIPQEYILIRQLCYIYDAWIVGSAALPDTDLTTVKDFDLILPLYDYHKVCPLIIHSANIIQPNTFGGWKVQANNIWIDIWPDDLTRLAAMQQFKAAWHPRENIRLIKI